MHPRKILTDFGGLFWHLFLLVALFAYYDGLALHGFCAGLAFAVCHFLHHAGSATDGHVSQCWLSDLVMKIGGCFDREEGLFWHVAAMRGVAWSLFCFRDCC